MNATRHYGWLVPGSCTAAFAAGAPCAAAQSGIGDVYVNNFAYFQKNADDSGQWTYEPCLYVRSFDGAFGPEPSAQRTRGGYALARKEKGANHAPLLLAPFRRFSRVVEVHRACRHRTFLVLRESFRRTRPSLVCKVCPVRKRLPSLAIARQTQ